jgi:hypothetical protein
MNSDVDFRNPIVRRFKRWRNILFVVALLFVVLWWIGIRLYYFAWIVSTGTMRAEHADFSALSRVLPPADASLVNVYGGLPHQMWAEGALLRDLVFTRNRSIGGYRFYTKPVEVPEDLRTKVSATLKNPMVYMPYLGPAACGGYHPDYCFEWRSSRGTFYALLCMGCEEINLVGDGAEVRCELRRASAKSLKELLKGSIKERR